MRFTTVGVFLFALTFVISAWSTTIPLTMTKKGDEIVCTVDTDDEAIKVIKKTKKYALVKASCGQGWTTREALGLEPETENEVDTVAASQADTLVPQLKATLAKDPEQALPDSEITEIPGAIQFNDPPSLDASAQQIPEWHPRVMRFQLVSRSTAELTELQEIRQRLVDNEEQTNLLTADTIAYSTEIQRSNGPMGFFVNGQYYVVNLPQNPTPGLATPIVVGDSAAYFVRLLNWNEKEFHNVDYGLIGVQNMESVYSAEVLLFYQTTKSIGSLAFEISNHSSGGVTVGYNRLQGMIGPGFRSNDKTSVSAIRVGVQYENIRMQSSDTYVGSQVIKGVDSDISVWSLVAGVASTKEFSEDLRGVAYANVPVIYLSGETSRAVDCGAFVSYTIIHTQGGSKWGLSLGGRMLIADGNNTVGILFGLG